MGTGPVPVSSLIAVLLICIGIGLFCGTGYVGCQQVYDAFNETYSGYTFSSGKDPQEKGELPDLVKKITDPVQIAIFCLSGFMVVMIVFFLFQAFMATAAINREDYSSNKMMCGNKGWTTVSVVLCYLLTILWMLIFVGSFYCFLLTYMIYSHQGTTYDWSTYGLSGGVVTFESSTHETFKIYMLQAYTMFAIFFGASFLIFVGMINLSMCHSANLANIKTSRQWQIYNERKYKEQIELNSYSNSGMVTSTTNIPLNYN